MIAAASEPACGSVSEKPPSSSPLTSAPRVALAQLGLAEARDRVRDGVVHGEREGVGRVAPPELLEDVHRLGQRGSLPADRRRARRGRAAHPRRRPRPPRAGTSPARSQSRTCGLDDVVGMTARGECERRAGRVGGHGRQSTLRTMRAVVQRVDARRGPRRRRRSSERSARASRSCWASARPTATAQADRLAARLARLRSSPTPTGRFDREPARHGRRGARHQPVHALRRHRARQPPELHRSRRARARRAPLRARLRAPAGRGRAARVERGRFGAHMQVELVNDGPGDDRDRALSGRRRARARRATVQEFARVRSRRCRCWKGGFSDPPFLCPGPGPGDRPGGH